MLNVCSKNNIPSTGLNMTYCKLLFLYYNWSDINKECRICLWSFRVKICTSTSIWRRYSEYLVLKLLSVERIVSHTHKQTNKQHAWDILS
jgi:hypothetical protein